MPGARTAITGGANFDGRVTRAADKSLPSSSYLPGDDNINTCKTY